MKLFAILTGALLCSLALLFPILSLQFGITWDDWHQLHYGRLVIRWYLSGGADTEALTWSNLRFYGGTFDTLTAFLYGLFSGNFHDFLFGSRGNDMTHQGLFELRHVLNSLVGVLVLFYTARIAKVLGGWRSAFLAVIIMIVSPRFVGHAMNNPKDIPFAFGYLMAVYHLIMFVRNYPSPRKRDLILMGVGVALAVGVRIAGVFLLGYAWLFILSKWAVSNFKRNDAAAKVSALKVLIWLAMISLIGYAGGMIAWPFALVNPVKNPVEVLLTLPHLISGNETGLFDGRFMKLQDFPWYYIPKWIMITSPFVFLAGLPLALGAFLYSRKQYPWDALIILVTSAAVPLILVLIQRPHFYNGWRHLLFIYSPLVILTALGWDKLLDLVRLKFLKGAVAIVFVALLAEPVAWMFRNHPNEYVYFNSLTGGIDGARGKYELDYWGNCMKEASLWLGEYHKSTGSKEPAVVQNQGNIMSSSYYLYRVLGDRYIPFSSSYILKMGLPANYHLILSNQLKSKNFDELPWPKDMVLYQVKADNTTLCAVMGSMDDREVQKL